MGQVAADAWAGARVRMVTTVRWRMRAGRVQQVVSTIPARILTMIEIERWERDMAITAAERLVACRQRKQATDPTYRAKEAARARASRQRAKERRIHQDAYRRALQRAGEGPSNG